MIKTQFRESGRWAIAHPVFGRIEGVSSGGMAAVVRHITTCPPSFRYPLTPLICMYRLILFTKARQGREISQSQDFKTIFSETEQLSSLTL